MIFHTHIGDVFYYNIFNDRWNCEFVTQFRFENKNGLFPRHNFSDDEWLNSFVELKLFNSKPPELLVVWLYRDYFELLKSTYFHCILWLPPTRTNQYIDRKIIIYGIIFAIDCTEGNVSRSEWTNSRNQQLTSNVLFIHLLCFVWQCLLYCWF